MMDAMENAAMIRTNSTINGFGTLSNEAAIMLGARSKIELSWIGET